MSTELTTTQDPMLFGIISPAMLKDIDVDKMQQLLQMKMTMDDRDAEKQLATALSSFQKAAPIIQKERRTNNSDYASLDDIMIAIRGHLSDNNLSVSFDTKTEEKALTAICYILHSGGAKFSRQVTVPIDTTMRGANASQQAGSASSYARRYALVAALNLIVSDHDDDGQSAGTAYVSDAHIDEIEKAMEATSNKTDDIALRDRILKWIGAKSVQEIPTDKVEMVLKELRRIYKESK